MKFNVESNIDIDKYKPNRLRKYPFDTMGVGDSFFAPNDDCKKIDITARLYSASSIYGTKNNKKFSVRRVDGGARVWRTE